MTKRRTGPNGSGKSAGKARRPAVAAERALDEGETELVDAPINTADGTSGGEAAGGVDGEAEADPAEAGPAIDRYVDDSGLMEALRQLKVRRDRNRDLTIGIGCGILGLVVGLVIGNTTAGSGGGTPTTVSPAVAASRGDLPDVTAPPSEDLSTTSPPTGPSTSGLSAAGVVTFTVTGKASGGVLISYGNNSTGAQSTTLPFTGSMPLDSSGGVLYYDVYAQLHGSGSLTCSVAVNGTVIKTGTATTTSSICSAQIAQDPATGKWQSE